MAYPVDFSKPELGEPNEPTSIITLRISGNRLVSLLNTLDRLMFETGRTRFEGNDLVYRDFYIQDMHDLTESIRDELSAQRNRCTADDIRASCRRAA